MKQTENIQSDAFPELSDQEWTERFVRGYKQSFDRDVLSDADDVLARVFSKHHVLEAV
jgi:hypothetical protein